MPCATATCRRGPAVLQYGSFCSVKRQVLLHETGRFAVQDGPFRKSMALRPNRRQGNMGLYARRNRRGKAVGRALAGGNAAGSPHRHDHAGIAGERRRAVVGHGANKMDGVAGLCVGLAVGSDNDAGLSPANRRPKPPGGISAIRTTSKNIFSCHHIVCINMCFNVSGWPHTTTWRPSRRHSCSWWAPRW